MKEVYIFGRAGRNCFDMNTGKKMTGRVRAYYCFNDSIELDAMCAQARSDGISPRRIQVNGTTLSPRGSRRRTPQGNKYQNITPVPSSVIEALAT